MKGRTDDDDDDDDDGDDVYVGYADHDEDDGDCLLWLINCTFL